MERAAEHGMDTLALTDRDGAYGVVKFAKACAAAGAAKRAAAEAGLPSAVTPREADDLVRDVEAFLAMVEGSLGLPGSQLLLASG